MSSVRFALLPAALLALSAFASCTFVLEDSIEQCSTDGECADLRNGDFVCDVAQKVCVRSGGGGGSGGAPTGPCDAADKPVEELTGDIARNTTLYCSRDYLMSGYVKVLENVTLTIQPGTRILGRGSVGVTTPPGTLIVMPGGKLIADGEPDAPIVFTSASEAPARGDWGGVAILGNAPLNLRDAQGRQAVGELDGVTEPITYGGFDPDDDSGVLRYARIEYSGLSLSFGSELNGLTLGGVGRRTIVDYVQVRETIDDCFLFGGGTVDAKHLICQRGGDDGFDIEQGYRGRLQFLVVQQDEQGGPFEANGIEAENAPDDLLAEPFTEPTVYNATLCGRGPDSGFGEGEDGFEQYGVLLRDAAKGHLFNLLVSGFNAGLDLGGEASAGHAESGDLEVGASLFFDNVSRPLAYDEDGGGALEDDDDGGFDENDWALGTPGNGTRRPDGFGDCFDATALRLAPAESLTDGAATPPSDGFFDPSATYYGAFRDADDDWAAGPWVVWGNR